MANVVIPEGATYIDTMKVTFNKVPVNPATKAVQTAEFLEAAESLTTMFGSSPCRQPCVPVQGLVLTANKDLLGSVAFSPVKKDMLGNVEVPNTSAWPPPNTADPIDG